MNNKPIDKLDARSEYPSSAHDLRVVWNEMKKFFFVHGAFGQLAKKAPRCTYVHITLTWAKNHCCCCYYFLLCSYFIIGLCWYARVEKCMDLKKAYKLREEWIACIFEQHEIFITFNLCESVGRQEFKRDCCSCIFLY